LLSEKPLRLCVKEYFGPSAKNKKDISRKGAKAQRRAILFKKTINFQLIKHLIFSPSHLLVFFADGPKYFFTQRRKGFSDNKLK